MLNNASVYLTTNNQPSFEPLSLNEPIGIQGGAILSKIDLCGTFLIQTCETYLKKFEIPENEPSFSINLIMSTNEQDSKSTIDWINNFENEIKLRIFETREEWFDGDIDKEDIDYFFQKSIRTGKDDASLKLNVTRLSKLSRNKLKNNRRCEEYGLNIFNEQEEPLDFEDINVKNQKYIAIIEPYGVKFSSTSFNVVYKLRQLMVLSRTDLVDTIINKCLIQPKTNVNIETNKGDYKEVIQDNKTNVKSDNETNQTNEEKENENIFKLQNIDINVDENSEFIQLKKPNQVYIDMYRDIRRKAKESKKKAEQEFLEAKQIKQMYQLNIDSETENESSNENE